MKIIKIIKKITQVIIKLTIMDFFIKKNMDLKYKNLIHQFQIINKLNIKQIIQIIILIINIVLNIQINQIIN